MRKSGRLLAGLLALVLVITTVPVTTMAASSTDIAYPVTGGNIYFDSATGTITDCDSGYLTYVTEVIIPSSINGIPVTSIGERAFSGCHDLKKVVIPNSIISIGEYTFSTCSGLTEISIPGSVSRIGEGAFWGCDSLENVNIADGVMDIGRSAFSGCGMLSEINLPESSINIWEYAFADCISLTSITLPSDILNIGENIFNGCVNLNEIRFSKETARSYILENGCLFDLSKNKLLCYPAQKPGTTYDIPSTVTTICAGAFSGCENLRTITMPNSVRLINDNAFSDCINLEEIVIPNNVEVIGESAFARCSSLKKINIPESVKWIYSYAFSGCKSLTHVTLECNLTYLAMRIFGGCSSLKVINIPDTVTNIDLLAFENCTSLSSIVLPQKLTSLNNGVFSGCTNLTSVYFEGNAPSVKIGTGPLDGRPTFKDCPDELTFYYRENSSGWTTPIWMGFKAEVFNGPAPSPGDGEDPPGSDVAVTGISLNKSTITLTSVGASETLIATVSPDNATNKVVTWTSSDESVATVVDGIITAVSNGTATIIATTAGGTYSTTCEVTVNTDTTDSGCIFPDGYDFFADSYGFTNYGESISKKYFTTIYEEGPGTALYKIKKNVSKNGLCFGMAYTTASIYNGYPNCSRISTLDNSLFNYRWCENIRDIINYNLSPLPDISSAFVIGDNTITIDDYIKYAFIYQWSSEVSNSTQNTWNDVPVLYNTVKRFTDNNLIGVTIGLCHYTQNSNGEWVSDSGHRVLAVGYEGNDILIDDPNNNKNLERLYINDNGTWWYSGAWTSDGVNSNNTITRYQTDFYRPYEILLTGNNTSTAPGLVNSNMHQETYVENIERIDAENILLYLEKPNNALLPKNTVEIIDNETIDVKDGAECLAKLYWIKDSNSVTVSNLTESQNTVILANDNTMLTINASQLTEINGIIDKDFQNIDFNAAEDDNCTISYVTVAPEKEVELRISGIAADGKISVQSTDNGVASSGLSNGSVELFNNDALVESIAFVDNDCNFEISYDTGTDTIVSVSADEFEYNRPSVPVTDISVTPTSITLTAIGETKNLTATISPSNATNQSVTWTSSNPSVATVSDTGVVTAVADGNTTITVTTADGGYTAECAVTVSIPPVSVPVTGISVTPVSITLTAIGEAKKLTTTISPGDATNKSVTWTSSSPSVATVSDIGVVTAVANGNTTITATTQDGGFSAACIVTVSAPSDVGNGGGSGSSSGSSSGGDSASYSVSVPSFTHGSVTVSPRNASKGSSVTITVKPDSGYALSNLSVTDKNGDTLKLTDKGGGKYTFTMPASNVSIKVSFAVSQEQFDPVNLPFTDVASGAWYGDAVAYVYEKGLMNGTSATMFSPDAATTRGMIVTILYRLEGAPTVSSLSAFTDVTSGSYCADAVAWASANGIVGGYGNGNFGPNDNITREQMAVMLYRYAGYKDYDTDVYADLSSFSDAAAISSFSTEALRWAVGEGLISGEGNGILDPKGEASRAQVATILMRFCENIAK